MGVTYDAGALIAAERGERRMWALHAGFLAESVVPAVPPAVLAQTWRGTARQVDLARMLAPCTVDPFDADAARRTGRLLAAAGTADVVDAAVVEGALRRGDAVVTGDPADLQAIAQAAGHHLAVTAP